ncbi:MAG: tRNA (guanosine(46)-N7)-methyltransferase TrmB [Planctomycetaceae bacterium]|nr:tRNA (guanosine(46)-N7)-methyltransferase TrmB [Planctomycetaceae bacterium]
MGRRALTKIRINEQPDFSRFYRPLEEVPKPLAFAELFGRVAPLELEIGSGKGLFLRTAARSNPSHDFLGVEIGKKYAIFSVAGIAKANLTNAVMICGDAAQLLDEWITPNSLHAVHVYFPDPWWKRAHKKRRILREEVVQLIERNLRPGGTLHFRTDVQEYFETTLALLASATKLSGPHEIPENEPQHDMDYHTHFERRTRLHGETVYRALFVKPAEQ